MRAPKIYQINMNQKFIRILLGCLTGVLAINALGGGFYGMAGAEGVPVEWLKGSPFKDYFIPGLILFAVIGGLFLVATVQLFRAKPGARSLTILSVGVVFIWLSVQVAILGYVSWMQPATAAFALLILFLALVMKK
jgi:hypothetical protein